MAQLGQKPHGFKDLDFLTVLKKTAVTFGADWKPVASQRNDRPHRRRRHPDRLMWRRQSCRQSCLKVLPASPLSGGSFDPCPAPSRRALLSTLSSCNPMRCPEHHTTTARSSARPPLHSPPCAVTYVN